MHVRFPGQDSQTGDMREPAKRDDLEPLQRALPAIREDVEVTRA
ncbi:MAG TPA: hypothetical protein VGC59_13235 [Solirubrobacteraceae bacterium]|jgi:hypothetical protein